MAKNLWYKLVSEFGETPIYNNGYNTMTPEKHAAMLKKGRKICPILFIGRFSLVVSDISMYEKWCNENLEHDYIFWNDSIYLKSEEDAIAFKLRWL